MKFMGRRLSCLGLGLGLACGAPAEEPRTMRDPGPFQIGIIDGETTSETAGDRGMISVNAEAVSQTLSWAPRAGSLEAVAQHELDLVAESARSMDGQLTTDGSVHRDHVGALEAARWSAQVDDTRFLGTAIDCPGARVMLVTFGPSEPTVQRTHRASLESLACDED